MKNNGWTFAALLCALSLINTDRAVSQTRLYGGVKGWYATWDLRIDRLEGVEQTDYSAALMAGPYVTLRLGDFTLSGSLSATVKHFEAQSRNPGFYYVGFNGNRILQRTDINFVAAYSISPEVGLFGTVKVLRYELKDATTYINGTTEREETVITATGFGGGAQVTVPFRDRSPFYAFTSIGAVANTFSAEEDDELLYFLESGMGLLVPGSGLALTLGIRGENGSNLKTTIGPMMTVFYRFM